MELSGFPVLSAIVFIPIIAGVLLLFLPANNRDLIRGVAITAASIMLALSAMVFFSYNNLVSTRDALQNNANFYAQSQVSTLKIDPAIGKSEGTAQYVAATQYKEEYTWVKSLGISYQVGMDGLTAPMLLLTGMVTVAGVLISWNIQDRQREFYAFFMLLVAGVYGVFVAVDLFVLFFFYELAIFPMYLLIAGWGWVKLREYAAMKLTLYILIGSVVALVGVLALYFTAGSFFSSGHGAQIFEAAKQSRLLSAETQPYNFSMISMTLAGENGAFDIPFLGNAVTVARFWFPFIFLGFAILGGIFPFHNWSPDGHVAAPTAVSMIHAGVLMKLGAYAALRVGVQIMPEAARVHLPWIVFLTIVNVVYGAFIAFRQRDFKYVIGFSSVSHMGLVAMGWTTMNMTGMTGAGLQMFSHGAMTALFFGCVGMVYDRAHTRDIPSLGGFMKKMPWVGVAFIVGGLTSMGMPGLSGFVAEFPIFQGMWKASPDVSLHIGNLVVTNYYSVIVILAALGIVITAAYVLRVTSQVFFGEFDAQKYPDVGDIQIQDRVILLLLGVPLIILGLYPAIMAPMISTGLTPILTLLGGK